MRPPEYRSEIVDGDHSTLESFRSSWDALCDEGPCRDPFYRPDWISAWCSAFAKSSKIRIVAVHQGTQLRALLPLVIDPGPGGILRSPTNFHSCRFSPVFGLGDCEFALSAVWKALLSKKDWHMIELQEVISEESSHFTNCCIPEKGLLASVRTAYLSPSLRIPEGALTLESVLGDRHTSFRRDLQKKERRLARVERVTFEPNAPCTEETISHFLSLEAAGWKGKSQSAILLDSETETFYRTVFRQEAARQRLRFGILRAGDAVIAMNFALQEGDYFYVPKTCYHEQFATHSPGQLLFYKTLEWCVSNNIRYFHFLGPTSQWKERWSNHTIPHQTVRLFRHSLVGYALYTRYHVAPKVRDYFKRKE